MAFSATPTSLLPNATNGTNQLIINTAGHASPTLAELSTAEANVSTGDLRKIAYALCERMSVWWNALATEDRPTRMTVQKSSQSISGTNRQYMQYVIQFDVDVSAEVTTE